MEDPALFASHLCQDHGHLPSQLLSALSRRSSLVCTLGLMCLSLALPPTLATAAPPAGSVTDLAPPTTAASTSTQSNDPAWLMVMMMTRPKVRAAVLGAKATGAPPGNVVVPRPQRSSRCQHGRDGNSKAASTQPAAGSLMTKASSKPKKPAKKRLLALFARPHAAVPASARMTLAQMKLRLLAAQAKAKKAKKASAVGSNSASKTASKTAVKPAQKPAPKLAKPAVGGKG